MSGLLRRSVLPAELADATNPGNGSGRVGFGYALGYAAGTVGRWLQDLATSTGSAAVGFVQLGSGSVPRLVQDELRDVFKITHYGVVGDWNGSTGTLNTTAAQQFFKQCEILVRPAVIPSGYYLTGPLTLGDPATATARNASNQGTGVYNIAGVDRQLSCFFAASTAAGLTLLKRNNLAGTTMRDFGADGRGLAAVGIDLSWTALGSTAPSTENVIERLYANNCTTTGIVLNNLYDSKISGIRSVGSPIGLSIVGGGGQLSLSESVLTGVLQVSAQNMSIDQVAILGGLDINGNTNNKIAIAGSQIFPILAAAPIPSQKVQYAIAADNSGTYGASLTLNDCYVFGGTSGCIFGNFALGIYAENCSFAWGAGAARMFGPITTGNPYPPIFHFKNCEFNSTSGVGGPVANPPTTGIVILENCYVNGVYYRYFNSADEIPWTPTLQGSGGTNSATTYSVQTGRVRRVGNVVHAFFDVAISAKDSGLTGIVQLGGLPLLPATAMTGGAAISLYSNITLSSGYSQLGVLPAVGSAAATLFQNGSGVSTTTIPAAGIGANSRISGVITYAVA